MKSHKHKNKMGVVYSTCPDFIYQHDQSEEAETLPPGKQRLLISLDCRRPGGKVVTVIENFVGTSIDLASLGKQLRVLCGTGGTVKEGLILLQGDFRQKVAHWLSKAGYTCKVR